MIHCENCDTALQGEYCHVCGQRAHNPLHHFGHAAEEVLESLWHVDGRIFRTLRDLMVPGRVAVNYMAGHRVRYIPPLRLFMVATLLAFFVAHFSVNVDPAALGAENKGDSLKALSQAKTAAEVEKLRATALREANEEIKELEYLPNADIAIKAVRDQINARADERLRELGISPAAKTPPQPASQTTPPANAPKQSDGKDTSAVANDAKKNDEKTGDAGDDDTGTDGAGTDDKDRPHLYVGGKEWDPRKDKVELSWLPSFANDWLTAQARHGGANIKRLDSDPGALKEAWLRTMPTTLFVLVPVFALLLKVFYFFARRTYLEHLVVALYSHAWLMMATLVFFVLGGIGNLFGSNGAVEVSIGLIASALTLWIPIYLFVMQKRVYRQGWLLTFAKYFVIGNIYFFMLGMAAAASLVIGIVKM